MLNCFRNIMVKASTFLTPAPNRTTKIYKLKFYDLSNVILTFVRTNYFDLWREKCYDDLFRILKVSKNYSTDDFCLVSKLRLNASPKMQVYNFCKIHIEIHSSASAQGGGREVMRQNRLPSSLKRENDSYLSYYY